MVVLIYLEAALTTAAVLYLVKRMERHEKFAMFFFGAAFAELFDLFFGATLNLYDYGRSGHVGVEDIVQVLFVNGALTVLFLNFLPRTLGRKVLYILGVCVVLALNEWIWLKVGLMVYRGWKFWYSLIAYPTLLLILYWVWELYRRKIAPPQAPWP